MANLLEIENLTVELMSHRGIVYALSGVDLAVRPGEIHGVVGESGCGKSMTAKSILRLHNPQRSRMRGSIRFEGKELLTLSNREIEKMRGTDISMIFQDPMTSLNPLMTIGGQIADMYRFHTGASKKEAMEKAQEMLAKVGIEPAAKRCRQYPFELSGGMQQRVMIAMAIACAATTAKHFADAQNRDLPKNNQINFISCMCAAIIGFLLLSSDTIATDAASGFNTTYLGSKGLLTAFIAAFVTGIIYKFFIKRNITVKMPEQVPPNISQTFKDIIPFSVCITVFWVFDIVFRAAFGFCFAQGVIQVFQPLFTAADGYIGLAVIYGAMSLFWFVGVHGPSIVEPAIAAALVANMTDNLAAFQAGQHASAVLTQGAQYFVVCMGGTGATLVLVFMFCFLAKSQEMRAVGKAAIVPVCFAVNEPLLFAAPIVLNPVFFVPFVFAPIANIWILKIFIDFLGMNGFMYTLPWTVPGPIGTIMGLGFQPLAFVMLALILVVDFVLYYPFFRAYDAQKCAEEAEISQEELAAKNAEKAAKLNDAFQGKADAKSVAAGAAAEAVKVDSPAASAAPAAEATTASDLNGKRVLVLCQGGGTSGLLANALAKAAKERGINLETAAEAYGNHVDMLPDFDLVVLAPQAASYLADLQKDCERVGNKCVACRGKQYIELSQNGDKSLAFVSEQLSK